MLALRSDSYFDTRLAARTRDTRRDLMVTDRGVFQRLEYLVRLIARDFHKREVIVQLNRADGPARNARFVGNRPDNIRRAHAVVTAHVEVQARHALVRPEAATTAP